MTQGLEIAFFGSSLISAYWNGAATYYRGLIRALNARGHRITFYEPDAFGRQEHRDMADPDWARVVVYPGNDECAALAMLEKARAADLIIKASGVGVFDELLERAILDLKSPRRTVVFWDVDAPATLERVEQNPSDPFRGLISAYDLILTYGGGPPVVKDYKKLGAAQCVPIYNALDPYTHFAVNPDPRFEADLAFLGNRLPDRERRVEEFFLSVADQLPDRQFLLGGSGWEDKPKSKNVRLAGHVYTYEHNAFNSTAQTILNINRESMARYGFSPPTRIFEAAGAKACIITDLWEGVELFLEPGREIFTARSGREVIEILTSVSPQTARQMGQAACQHIFAAHTYTHRAEQLEEILEGKFTETVM